MYRTTIKIDDDNARWWSDIGYGRKQKLINSLIRELRNINDINDVVKIVNGRFRYEVIDDADRE